MWLFRHSAGREAGDHMTGDLTGRRFGRWLVVSRAAPPWWNCVCDCGTEKAVRKCSLIDGSSQSCRCYSREFHSKLHGIHYLSHTPTHHSWVTMKQRCYTPSHKSFKDYGGRGITVCERWRENFAAFAADMGVRPERTTLDRIDNSGNYEPGNCRWASMHEQQNNRRSNRPITWRGETHNLKIWAHKVGLSCSTLRQRLAYVSEGLPGWTLDECMTRPKPARWR